MPRSEPYPKLPFICDKCEWSFKRSTDLARHRMIKHMSNKENFGSPCKFENCRYRSALPYNLKKHYLNVHLKKSPPPELECTGPASDTPDEREQGIFRLEMKPQFDLECNSLTSDNEDRKTSCRTSVCDDIMDSGTEADDTLSHGISTSPEGASSLDFMPSPAPSKIEISSSALVKCVSGRPRFSYPNTCNPLDTLASIALYNPSCDVSQSSARCSLATSCLTEAMRRLASAGVTDLAIHRLLVQAISLLKPN